MNPLIKPLQWEKPHRKLSYEYWIATLRDYRRSQSLYEIRRYDDEMDGFYLYWHLADREHAGPFPTLESAQAAAQKDWERFIKAAVNLP